MINRSKIKNPDLNAVYNRAARAAIPMRPGKTVAMAAPPVAEAAVLEELEALEAAEVLLCEPEEEEPETCELRLLTAELTEAEADEIALLALEIALETALPVVAVEAETEPEVAVGAPKLISEVLEATVTVLSMTK